MQSLVQKLSLSALMMCFMLFTSFVFADNTELSEQLARIEEIVDKNEAIKTIQKLLNSNAYTARQKLSIMETHARLAFSVRNFEQAIIVTEQIRELANKNKVKRVEAKAYKMLGIFYYYKADYPQALAFYQTALGFYHSFNDDLQQANLFNNIGLVYAAMGETLQALNNYQKAEAIYKRKGTERDLIDLQYNIAGLYLRLRRFDSALEMFTKVIDKRLEYGDLEDLASAYSDIGVTHKQLANYDQALAYLLKALDYYQTKNDFYHLASTYHNLAEVYNELERFEQAEKYAKQAVNLSESKGYKGVLSGSLQSLARSLFLQGESATPIALLDRSTKLAKESGYQQQIRINHSFYALFFSALGERDKALKHYQNYIKLNYQITNNELNKYLAQFESSQAKQELNQELERLQQNEELQKLKLKQSNLQRNFIFVGAFLSLLVFFFIFRRRNDLRMKEKLAIQVKERTEELECLTDELMHANNVKSQFLANMSHEIRTPLTAIIGQAEAIRFGEVRQEQLQQEVDIIHNNSLHLLELINNILDLSKIEANKFELELQSHDIHTILLEIANIFTKQASSKGLKFEISHTLPTPFTLEVDGLRIKQILINLCSNAIKFTSSGCVSVKVYIRENQLAFKVHDTGIGMSYSQTQQVFDSFSQGDSSISRRFGGSGLGLCLSDQLAKLMGGHIEVESTLNEGSTFTFILPCVVCRELKTSNEERLIEVKQEEPKTALLHGKVLLADDHDDNRHLIARFLEQLGLDVIQAKNGFEAVELCFKHTPQVILLDIQMPEMDGIEAFNHLRQKGCMEPIVALTANAMAHEVEQYIELGFDAHLKKPIERAAFTHLLGKYFNTQADSQKMLKSMGHVDMSDLVQQFKSNLALEQQDIVLQINNEDFVALSDLVHKIAGSAQMFGFALLSEKAIKLELAIKANAINKVAELSQDLLNEIDQVLW